MRSPLDGIKVLDLTIWQNGPWATVMLSDMGADVIKIEDPVNGDPGRGYRAGKPLPINSYFQTLNRNKRSMTLDLKQTEGQEIFLHMASTADVVVQNFRAGVAEKLGISYEAVRKVNPKIVYASVTGFGPKGPDARDGVFDILGQARGGFMYMQSVSLPDMRYITQGGLADQMGALTLAHGLLLGLLARERYGIGQHIETSQLGGQMMLQATAINGYLLNNDPPKPRYREQMLNPLFNIYKCGDGKWIALGCVQPDRYWADFCEVLGLHEIEGDARYGTLDSRKHHAKTLVMMIDGAFAARSRGEWLVLLKKRGILCTPVQDYAELAEDPQVIANEYLAELDHPTLGKLKEVGVVVKLSETPGRARKPAPEFGEHTEEVLLAHGYSWDQIADFRGKRVI